jgi:16S rRNA processing protein RimM
LVDTPGPEPGTPLADIKLVVGTVAGAHGLRGELKVALATDDPEHLARLKRLWLGDEPRPRKVLGIRFHAGQALIRLGGIATPEAAREYRGQRLRMAGTDARPLPPGEYRLYQLIGLEAVTEGGESLGTVSDILETGANDVFVITPAGGGPDLLLPYHPDVILDVSPAERRMLVRPLRYYDEVEGRGS